MNIPFEIVHKKINISSPGDKIIIILIKYLDF